MDQASIDQLAKALGSALSRRAGFREVIGSALGAAALTADTAAKNRRGTGKGGPKPEGPCGNGSRKDNICSNDGDCCTGICKTGLKNKDGEGRCRCRRKGKECSADKNCCRGMTCVAGVCGGGGGGCDASTCANGCCDGTTCIAIADQSTAACGTNGHACVVCANGAACVAGVCAANLIPTGQACVAGVDTCEDPTAQCIQYGSGPEEFGAPTGTFCLWPDAAPCSPPGIQATFCAEGYCAPNGSDPAFCGTLTYTSECTSNTDSGAGSVVWSPAQFAACGVSPDDYKEVYMGPGSATTTCTSLADCVSSNPSNVVCIDNTSASSLFTIGGMAIGGYCASGFYQCMTANDCPPLQGYTANCSPIGSLMGCGYIP